MHLAFVLARAQHPHKSPLEICTAYLCATADMQKWSLTASLKHKTQHLLRRLFQSTDFIPYLFETLSLCFGQFAESTISYRADAVAAAHGWLQQNRASFPTSLFALLTPEDICDCFRGAALLDAHDFHNMSEIALDFVRRSHVTHTIAWQMVSDTLTMMIVDGISVTSAWRKTLNRERQPIGTCLELIPRLNDDAAYLKEKKDDREAGITGRTGYLPAPTGVCYTHPTRLIAMARSPLYARAGPPLPKPRQSAAERKQGKQIAAERTENQQNRADFSAKVREKGGLSKEARRKEPSSAAAIIWVRNARVLSSANLAPRAAHPTRTCARNATRTTPS